MTRPAPLTKECNTCGRILPINDFYKEKTAKAGFRNCCKHCYIEKQSMKRAKDPDNKVKHRTKVHPVKVERSCTLCANYPCFEGIENLESDFAQEGCKSFTKKENKKQ